MPNDGEALKINPPLLYGESFTESVGHEKIH